MDCSGFISRVWWLNGKYRTCTLPLVSCLLGSLDDLEFGDILNKCEDHVVMYSNEGGGVYAYESTVNHSYDRVVFDWEPWSRYNGYEPRRYHDKCGGCP